MTTPTRLSTDTIPPFRTPGVRWEAASIDNDFVKELEKNLDINSTLARLVAKLGLKSVEEAQKFLFPKLSDLAAPEDVKNINKAVRRLTESLYRNEKIVILGDYDVDGITATTLLVLIMRRLGLNPNYFVPRRMEEGYGLSQAIVDRALQEHTPDLLIAVDCGTNAAQEVINLKKKGVDVLILDHHRATQDLPSEAILVNPHVHDAPNSPWMHLCAVGIVFKLVHAWIKQLRLENFEPAQALDLKNYLDLVAMGTVADLVPLQGENRIFVKYGLKTLHNSIHPGVQALLDVSGIDTSHELQPSDVSFRLGPRINASGRLADAQVPLEMLLTNDWQFAQKSANQLNILNRQRQDIERIISHEAETLVEKTQLHLPAIVAYDPNWHSGVVGIVAGRLSRKFYKPAIVLGIERQGLAKGSGRSVPGVNLVEALRENSHLLESWGGHPMAVGISLNPANLEIFQHKFCECILKQLSGQILEPTLEIATWIIPEDLNENLLDHLEQLRPFGEGNPEPILGVKNAIIAAPIITFGENHYRFFIKTPYGPLSGVAWNRANHLPPSEQPIELAIKFAWNYWNGRRIAQAELLNWRFMNQTENSKSSALL